MSASNDKIDFQHLAHLELQRLELESKFLLKCLREKVNWENANVRQEFLCQLDPVIRDWEGRYPDFEDVFPPEEIERLLFDCATRKQDEEDVVGERFVKFVAHSGYKLQPNVDENGKPILRRTTPVYQAAKNYIYERNQLIPDLCIIYDYVNYIDEGGFTHFHAACECGNEDVVKKFLGLGQDPNLCVTKTGDSPLFLACMFDLQDVAETLLRHGADPNLANKKGWTPLHYICRCLPDHDFLQMFLQINDELNQPLKINAVNNTGDTVLHYAIVYWYYEPKIAELLLRRGADLNLANVKGLTPLEKLCNNDYHYETLKKFFDISDELSRPVRVNFRDNLGRTPLQWAVANHLPDMVKVLLDNGADLSGFVYPAEIYFNHAHYRLKFFASPIDIKSRQASGALLVVERLERSGYELDRSEALMIMKWFAKKGLFEKSADLEKRLLDDEKFVIKAKEIMVKPGLSLYDLIRLSPKEAKKQMTYTDFFGFMRANISRFEFDEDEQAETCAVHLCEKISRRFFQSWALDPFVELTHYRLPILCCEMIIENLKNEDLYHICLAAWDQSSEDKKRIQLGMTYSSRKCKDFKIPLEYGAYPETTMSAHWTIFPSFTCLTPNAPKYTYTDIECIRIRPIYICCGISPHIIHRDLDTCQVIRADSRYSQHPFRVSHGSTTSATTELFIDSILKAVTKQNNKVTIGIETVMMHNLRNGTIRYMELLPAAPLLTSIFCFLPTVRPLTDAATDRRSIMKARVKGTKKLRSPRRDIAPASKDWHRPKFTLFTFYTSELVCICAARKREKEQEGKEYCCSLVPRAVRFSCLQSPCDCVRSRCCASAMTIGWPSRLQQQGSSGLVLQLLHAQRFEPRGSSAAKKHQQQLCKNYTRAQVSRGKAVFACKSAWEGTVYIYTISHLNKRTAAAVAAVASCAPITGRVYPLANMRELHAAIAASRTRRVATIMQHTYTHSGCLRPQAQGI
ncbi:unnamed protein product [Trichogramma brassicae]|uniref:Uncharacterized protein n=1 Tax=Trichogramma brassicae TaxID=86971 RepID=A0A6H5IHI0_9HYME|nr:unnamed protein product [Trichogramma brassicae]